MTHPRDMLDARFREAIVAAFGADYADVDPIIRPAKDPAFGDFQSNVAMGLARRARRAPRQIAEAITGQLDRSALVSELSVAGPGFINVTLESECLTRALAEAGGAKGIPAPGAGRPERVVLDYSGPNVAKEMHVGHLRSTVIGDSLGRVLESLGHELIRQNHLGDWGTQFGMLTEYLVEQGGLEKEAIGDLNQLYRAAQARFEADPDFAERARRRVVALQGGDPETLGLWKQLVAVSREHFQAVYERLGVRLAEADARGESFYNDRLPGVVRDLEALGLVEESRRAKVVALEGFTDREGEPLPLMVQKSDGGYLYASTDLAAARYRIEVLGARRLIYVTDSRQGQHFAMVFATLRAAGWAGEEIRLDHVPFGTVLGPDRKPFKTRSGESVRLADLLEEAEKRARAILEEKGSTLEGAARDRVARAIGIGALKYADLSSDRVKDYVFDWDRMLAFDGNTAPYLQNAVVRIHSIFRKGGLALEEADPASIRLGAPVERQLALALLDFGTVSVQVAQTLEPHRLCTYLHELATTFHRFYEQCPVLKAPDEATRAARLALARVTAEVLTRGLELLGIETVERM